MKVNFRFLRVIDHLFRSRKLARILVKLPSLGFLNTCIEFKHFLENKKKLTFRLGKFGDFLVCLRAQNTVITVSDYRQKIKNSALN